MTRLRSAPSQGTGLNDHAHHATVRIIQTSATRHAIATDKVPFRRVHSARISNGGMTYKKLDSVAVLNAPPIAAIDQRGGLNCKARKRQAIPVTHDMRKFTSKRFLVVFKIYDLVQSQEV